MKKFRKIKFKEESIYIDIENLNFKQKYFGSIIVENEYFNGFRIKETNNFYKYSISGTVAVNLLIGRNLETLKELTSYTIMGIGMVIIIVLAFLMNYIRYMYINDKIESSIKNKQCDFVRMTIKEKKNGRKKKYEKLKILILLVVSVLSFTIIYHFDTKNNFIILYMTPFIMYFMLNIIQFAPSKYHTDYIIDKIRDAKLDDLK